MATPQDPAEHALVIKALTSGLSNCVEWIDTWAEERIKSDTSLVGIGPNAIRRALLQFALAGGTVEQVLENRNEYKHRRFYYKAIIPHPLIPKGIFVEMELEEKPDPIVPRVFILNAHP
jgi:hypothetical protein